MQMEGLSGGDFAQTERAEVTGKHLTLNTSIVHSSTRTPEVGYSLCCPFDVVLML